MRFPGDARKARQPGISRADDPDRCSAMTALPGLVGVESELKPRSYVCRNHPRVLSQVELNVLLEPDWDKGHTLVSPVRLITLAPYHI